MYMRTLWCLIVLSISLVSRTYADEEQAIAAIRRVAPNTRIEKDKRQPDKPVVKVILGSPRIKDADLKNLVAFKQLRNLALWQTGVTNEGLKTLAELDNLRRLELYICDGITNDGMKELAALKQLRTLNISLTRHDLTDRGVKALVVLKQLQTLYIASYHVTDASLKEIAAMPNLKTLGLKCQSITGKGLKHLAALKKLQELDLSSTKLTEEGMKELATLEHLKWLNLCYTDVTDAGLKHLSALKQLRTLYLYHTPQVTEKSFDELSKALPKCKISVDDGLPSDH
jgi:internalin A